MNCWLRRQVQSWPRSVEGGMEDEVIWPMNVFEMMKAAVTDGNNETAMTW